MRLDSAPGPDGFTGHFFVQCWDIIKEDFGEAVRGFFTGLQLPCSFTSTYLTLLPKVPNATVISQLRPISLCNFCHKIISRILMNRLAKWLPRLISEEQSGFIPGRSIHDNIALAHDLAHDLHQKVTGGNLIIKLDMAKAYDRVSWSFILGCFRAFGFNEKWCDLIYRCISNNHYSVKWDGQVYGFFKSFRGVRQGDPLSPSLFVIAMEWFSRNLKAAVDNGRVKPYFTHYRALNISHLLFADDMLILTNGAMPSLRNLMNIINKFCDLSGQKLNPDKSHIVFHERATIDRKAEVCSLTGFSEGSLPMMYLGAPLYRGRTLIEYFKELEEKVTSKVAGWMSRFLSMGGRVTLINAVLNTVGVHCLMVLPVPVTVLSNIQSIIGSFLWDSRDSKRHHWVSWSNICRSKDAGGLGIRDPKNLMLAFHGKLAWKYINRSGLWARYARSRFKLGSRGSPLWNSFSHLITAIQGQCTWILGRGDTLVRDYCDSLGVHPPVDQQDLSMHEVINDEDHVAILRSTLPVHLHQSLDVVWSGQHDRIVWNNCSGGFTTRDFWNSFQTRHSVLQWTKAIWNHWLPAKIACFVWKLFMHAIPSDDAVSKVGINMVSKCACCSSPSVESTSHLFFDSEWSRDLWKLLGSLLNRPVIRNLNGLVSVWLKGKQLSFLDCLASGLACCGIWEIWRARNNMRFEGKSSNWKAKLFIWVNKLSKLIKCPHNGVADHFFWRLGVHHFNQMRGQWKVWKPGDHGVTLNLTIVESNDTLRGGSVFRNNRGEFVGACWCEVGKLDYFHDLMWYTYHSLTLAQDQNLDVRFVQSSHPGMRDLCSQEWECPSDIIYDRRSFLREWPNIRFMNINEATNGAATIIAYSSLDDGFTRDINLLSRAARVRVRSDLEGVPVFGHDGVFMQPMHSEDDFRPSRRSVSSMWRDDSNIRT